MRFGTNTILAVSMLISSISCHRPGGQGQQTSNNADQEVRQVTGPLTTIALQPWPTLVRVQGSLVADEVTSVAARVAGRVVAVEYDLGDSVQAGDALIRLDPREFELKLAQAEAQLSQARAAIGLHPDDPLESLDPVNSPPVREARAVRDEARQQLQRLEPLFQQGAIVANDWETAQSLMSVAEARYNSAMNGVREKIAMVRVQSALLELARQEIEDTTIPAPFNGLIQSRTAALGMYVQVGEPLMEIAKTDRLRYRASVPERFAGSLAVGQSVRINVGGQRLSGKVERIAPALDPLNRSLTFEAMVDNSEGLLRAGLFAPAELVLNENSQAVVIQPDSLVRFAGVDKVWRVDKGMVQEAVVLLGRETSQGVEVLEGLAPGDQILQNARDGAAGFYAQDAQNNMAWAEKSAAPVPDLQGKPVGVEPQAKTAEQGTVESRSAAAEAKEPRT